MVVDVSSLHCDLWLSSSQASQWNWLNNPVATAEVWKCVLQRQVRDPLPSGWSSTSLHNSMTWGFLPWNDRTLFTSQNGTSSAHPNFACSIVLACCGFCNTRVFRGCGTCRNSKLGQHNLARPGPQRIFAFLDNSTESERCFWLETLTANTCTVLLANVLGGT